MVAQHGADGFAPVSQLCLQSVKTAIDYQMESTVKEKKSKSTQFYHARDNAIAALGKVLKYQSNAVDLNQLMPFWLSNLPLSHDMEEAHIQNLFLSEAALKQPTFILGQNYERLEQFVTILGEICCKKQSDALTLEMLSVIVANISQDANLSGNFQTLCKSKLNEESQQRVIDVYNKCNEEVRQKVQAHIASL